MVEARFALALLLGMASGGVLVWLDWLRDYGESTLGRSIWLFGSLAMAAITVLCIVALMFAFAFSGWLPPAPPLLFWLAMIFVAGFALGGYLVVRLYDGSFRA